MEMEEPKIPDSIRKKLFYFSIKVKEDNWELVKKESSGKYTILKSIFSIFDNNIFECEINQNDIQKMYNEMTKGKKTEYNPPLFLRIKGKLYYSYIISIPPTDFTNNQKRILSFFYSYQLSNLLGFHPFTKNKNPPLYYNIGDNKKNCFAKFYQLYKTDITNDIFDTYFQKLFDVNEYINDNNYFNFPFLVIYLEFQLKNGIIEGQLEKIILSLKSFSWSKKYDWETCFPDVKKDFYNYIIKPLFLGENDNFKKIYSIFENESRKVLDKLFITYDFIINDFKYYNNENLLSSCLNTLKRKQDFYELYYELLLDNRKYRRDFKYKKYLGEEFKEKILNKYLLFEKENLSWKKFDFAGEDKYGTSEGGGGCYFRKEYHVSSYSYRKTKKGELLYIDYEIKHSYFLKTYNIERHFYLNNNIINLPLYGISSTFSFDDDNIIVTNYEEKPYIYNLRKGNKNEEIIFDKFYDKCHDAIMLENKLIVVSGLNSFGYYCQNDKNNYKLI